jgi:transketolase
MTNKTLVNTAKAIRQKTLSLLYNVGSGHLASSMSIVEIITYLYFGGGLQYRASQPDWKDRDYFILSNGHACPSFYVALGKAGYFSLDKIQKDLFALNSGFEGHPVRKVLPGIEISSGSLGMGLSVGVGIALGLKQQKRTNRVVVMVSDAEQQEGAVWEAVMAASHYRLNNLTLVVDNNGIQIGGLIKDNLNIEPMAEKYLSFGWNIKQINGHDFSEIKNGFDLSFSSQDRPTVIIAKTIPAKGVYKWEGNSDTHHKKLTKEIYKKSVS